MRARKPAKARRKGKAPAGSEVCTFARPSFAVENGLDDWLSCLKPLSSVLGPAGLCGIKLGNDDHARKDFPAAGDWITWLTDRGTHREHLLVPFAQLPFLLRGGTEARMLVQFLVRLQEVKEHRFHPQGRARGHLRKTIRAPGTDELELSPLQKYASALLMMILVTRFAGLVHQARRCGAKPCRLREAPAWVRQCASLPSLFAGDRHRKRWWDVARAAFHEAVMERAARLPRPARFNRLFVTNIISDEEYFPELAPLMRLPRISSKRTYGSSHAGSRFIQKLQGSFFSTLKLCTCHGSTDWK